MRKYLMFPLLLLVTVSGSLFLSADESMIDYNIYYKFPISIGMEYKFITPVSSIESGEPYSIMDLAAVVRVPLPFYPRIQPTLKSGFTWYDSNDYIEPDKWDHTDVYAGIGALYSAHMSKEVELGGELLFGASSSMFSNLGLTDEDGDILETVTSSNFFISASGKLGYSPSYSLGFELVPALKYQVSLNENMKNFDGLGVSFGLNLSFRAGSDPDAAGTLIRSIMFSSPEIPDAFAAMQSWYTKNPSGRIHITNTDKQPISKIEVLFFQKGYMDAPTQSAVIDRLLPGEEITVELFSFYNDEVFQTEGVKPMTGEVIVKYDHAGKAAEQSYTVSNDLYDKTALTWNDDRKVAAFITPADSALRNYVSFIRQSCRESIDSSYREELQTAAAVFNALGEIGCLYQADPAAPFSSMQENLMVIDSISLARDTLKRLTGDCDDLTVLYCSLLESAGIETAFLTVPGHIYVAFNTGINSGDYSMLHPEESMTIEKNGKLWLPVEITLTGLSSFPEAWERGALEWNQFSNSPEERGFYITREAQEIYRPVGLRESDLGLQYGNAENIERLFRSDMEEINSKIIETYKASAEHSGKKADYNRLGIVCGKLGLFSEAESALKTALRKDPGYTFAMVNLGNVFMLQQKYSDAADYYEKAADILKAGGKEQTTTAFKIYINLSRCYSETGNQDNAAEYYRKAESIDRDRTSQLLGYSPAGAPGGARASGISFQNGPVFYIGEDDE